MIQSVRLSCEQKTMPEKEKYIAWVEADAGISLEARSEEEAREILENTLNTGALGPPKVRNVERDDA